ncbi:cubilin-like [Gigantopelta aegis]|uniref:cubilin-like n=1 Tax=Gigantopelta aegis TaxID=1735272 RepID=UPI001B88AC4C|nr:cubilin-like [Gigantopelta aegis]
MEGFPIGFVVLLFVFCSRSLAGEELQYTTLGQLAFGCPQGWKAFETNCYFLADFKMEFEDAEETCENLGTMSLKIDDDIENKKIAEFARNVSWTRFWNGQKYSDSTKCDGIWGNNQPPEGTQDGACVSVGENGLWKVTSCKELLPFVCKKPACINGTSDCGNGKCINTKWFCDGINDCSNNLDEMNCANRCSFYKTGASGTITQGSYKPNADCFWTIEGPVGTQLKLTFTRVRTEKDRDIIEVWGGSKSLKSSTKLTTLSGDSDNRVVYSFNNFLIIRFRSDATVESSGFVATWRSDVAELSRTVQDIAASDNWQSLSSPFYPSTPPYGFSRHWLITTEADSILTLEILEVDLNSDWELLIYDGDSYMEQPVTIKMSSDLRSPPIYISSSNKIRVVLKGIKIMSGKGINMRVKKVEDGAWKFLGHLLQGSYPVME